MELVFIILCLLLGLEENKARARFLDLSIYFLRMNMIGVELMLILTSKILRRIQAKYRREINFNLLTVELTTMVLVETKKTRVQIRI